MVVCFGWGSDMGVWGKGNVGFSLFGFYVENLVLFVVVK